jgi:hypothetical protein
VIWFPILDLGVDQNDVSFLAGTCEPMNGPTMCGPPADPADQINATADIQGNGVCYEAEATALGDGYDAPNEPAAPCFGSAPADATLNLHVSGTDIPLVLRDAQLAAAFDGDRLSAGTLLGFVTEADAMVTQIDDGACVDGGAACETTRDDTDTHPVHGRGVWIYFNFEADPISWSG